MTNFSQHFCSVPGPAVLEVGGVSSTSIEVRWQAPIEPRGDITSYTLSTQLGSNLSLVSMVTLPSVARQHNITSLKFDTDYRVNLTAVNSVGGGEVTSMLVHTAGKRTHLHDTESWGTFHTKASSLAQGCHEFTRKWDWECDFTLMFVFSGHVLEVTLIKELWWDYSNRKEEVDLIPSSVAIQKVASKAELKCYNTFHFSSFWRRWFDKIDESCLVYYAHQAKLCQQNSYWNAWWSFLGLFFFLVAPAVILSKSITVVTVEVGSPALLPCITFGNPIPVTQWTNATNGSIMAVFRQANASFLIANTRLRDGGVYVCSTSNEWGSDSHNVTLVVQGEWIVLPEWQACWWKIQFLYWERKEVRRRREWKRKR